MSEFLTEVLAAEKPVAREVDFGGRIGTVWFRRLSAGQRAQLLKGQKVSTRVGETAEVQVDLGENENTKLQMLQFCVCHEDGRPYFKDLAAVQKIPQDKASVLYEHASAVNGEVEEPGKP